MLPHPIKKKVILDPAIKAKNFFFGPINKINQKECGTIINKKYINVLKTYVYEVKFKTGPTLWFKECELI